MYIEFVIADNFILTFLAGAAAARLCHKRVNIIRTVIAAAMGTLVAVFYPFMKIGFWAQLGVKLALWTLLSAALFLRTPRPVTSALMFLGATFTFGGACYAVWECVCTVYPKALEFCSQQPVFLTMSAAAALYAGVRFIVKRIRVLRSREPYECLAVIDIFGKNLKFSAFMDSGNCVFDDRSGLPIIITDAERFTSKLDGPSATEFLKRVDRLRATTIRTAAGETRVYLLKPTSVTVYTDKREHKIDVMVGLIGGETTRFSRSHELLIGPSAIAEGV